jgi:hypothetical protein
MIQGNFITPVLCRVENYVDKKRTLVQMAFPVA